MMKRVLMLLLAVLLNQAVFAQTDVGELKEVGEKLYGKNNKPFTGEIALHFDNGKLRAKGMLKDGLREGMFTLYSAGGFKVSEIYFVKGVLNGPYRDYYSSGELMQEVNSKDGEDDGTATMYYDTGEKKVVSHYEKGVKVGDYIEYDKKGNITRKLEFVNGKISYGKKIDSLVTEALGKRGERSKEAIALYTRAIEINPNIAQLYFNRGATRGSSFDFDGAIVDYDRAISLDSLYKEAYANRGSAKINRYTSKGNITPTAEQMTSACEDLYKAKELGDGEAVDDLIYVYCERNGIKPKPVTESDSTKFKPPPLVFLNGQKIRVEELSKLNPNDVLEIQVIKSPDKTALYGPGSENGVVLVTMQKFATEAYQKVIGSFSKEYAAIATVPDTFLYKINGVLLEGKLIEAIRKLYAIKADDLLSVIVDKTGTKPIVSITTKKN